MDSDTEEDLEDKKILRYDLYYLMYKLTKVIGFMRVFTVIGARINVTIELLKQNDKNVEALSKLEAELYVLTGALKKINTNEPEMMETMQKMLELILTFNYPKQKVLYTALKILSKSSSFFGARGDLLQAAFKLLANCINEKKFEKLSAEAISNLCKSNRGFVLENLDDFVNCKRLLPSLRECLLSGRHRSGPG